MFNWRLLKKAGQYGLIAIGAAVTMASLCIVALMVLPDEILYRDYFLEAKRYIVQLEEYKQKNGYYPGEENQNIVPGSETDHVFYNGRSSGYTLDLTLNFDVNYCCFSETRDWSFGICPKPK